MIAHLCQLKWVREPIRPRCCMHLLHQGSVVDGEESQLAVHLKPLRPLCPEGACDGVPEFRHIGSMRGIKLSELLLLRVVKAGYRQQFFEGKCAHQSRTPLRV